MCSLSAGTRTRRWNSLLRHHFLLFRQKFIEDLKSFLLGKLIVLGIFKAQTILPVVEAYVDSKDEILA